MAINIEKNNSGFATLNKYATTEAHPKYKGVVKVNDVQMEVACWIKESKKTGDRFISFQFQTEEEGKQYRKNETQVVPEDELPF